MKTRILYLAKFYACTLLVFMLAKTAFMLCHRGAHPFGVSDVAAVLRHGLSLDLSTSLYLFLVPFVAVTVSVWLRRWTPVRTFLLAYSGVAAVALALAFVADTSLYAFWGFKLDASVFLFLDGTGHAFDSVSPAYVAVRVVAVTAVAYLIYNIYRWLTPRQQQRRRAISELGHFRAPRQHEGSVAPVEPTVRRLAATAGALLCAPLLVVGIRGGLSVSTTNVGQAYFSDNQFLNHAAVNPLFSFLSSFGKSSGDVPTYDFFDEAQCRQLLSGLFFTDGQPADTLLTTRRPNVLLIIMESCGGQFTEIGGRPDVTPHLTRLSNEGAYFTQCYANSWRTDRGMVSILSGWPAFPKTSVMKMASKCASLPGLARSLGRHGYRSSFLYGGDADFTNTRGYLLSTGTQTIISEDDFTAQERGSSKWGVCDSIAFDRLYSLTTRPSSADADAQSPWFLCFLTLSSHEPWTVPMPTKFNDKVLNAFYYMDHCLGRFIERFRQTPEWQHTLVILIPDHGILYDDIDETKPLRAHIPMIWTGGAVARPCRIDRLCNQSDLAATLLGQLGIGHDDYPFSRDVLSTAYRRPFAMHTHTDGFSVWDADGFSAYDLNSGRVVAGTDGQAVSTGKAVLQATAADLRAR